MDSREPPQSLPGIYSPKIKRGRPRKYSPDQKRGRPRKYTPLPLSSYVPADLSPTSDEPPAKKSRGRQAGSGKKKLDALGVGVTYLTPHVILVNIGEGLYQIISLSGSFNTSEEGACRTGGMRVSLAGDDGIMLGGSVSGMLVAASEIRVIVSSFIVEGKKKSIPKEKTGPSPAATPSGTQVVNSGASSVTPTSATSQGVQVFSSDEYQYFLSLLQHDN
ncbi:hypothetical protein K1719_036343 [Acacia pycnantha]|nr:hypothetical protein K1719_036343 [Acacia pycnantha]